MSLNDFPKWEWKTQPSSCGKCEELGELGKCIDF